METQWFYAQDGQQKGPVPASTLSRLLAERQLAATDLVWREGLPEWQPASNFPELFPAASTSAPPPPPPMASVNYGGYGPPSPTGQSYNGTAVASFVVGLVGILCCGGGLILGIIAFILGQNALTNMQRSGNYEGQGLATAGRILGIIGIILSVIFICSGGAGRLTHNYRF